MTRSNITTVVVTLFIASLVWYIATSYPFGQQEQNIISLQGAPQKIVTLNAGDTASQTFRPVQPLIASLSIYAVNDHLASQKLTVTISDASGADKTTSHTVRSSYQDEKLKLTFPIDWLETNNEEELAINITLNHGAALQLFTTTENVYQNGYFSINNKPADGLDLSLSSTEPSATTPATKKGVAAGLIVFAGALLIQLIPRHFSRWRWIAATLLLIIVTPLALGGFWQNRDLLGINDWDYYFSIHEVLRRSVTAYHAFPLWNPFTCGGTAGLADPEFPLFTPTFLLELIFGIPTGLRLAIFFSTAVGALGMLALGKRLGLSPPAALLASLAAFFGSVNLLEIVEGHPNILSAMWIPWIFWGWLTAYTRSVQGSATRSIRSPSGHGVPPQARRGAGRARASLSATATPGRLTRLRVRNPWTLLTGVFLALTFYQGGIYLLMYTALAFLILPLLVSRPRDAIIVTFKAGLWALGLAAVKLVPALFWLSQFQDQAYASSTTTLPYLYEIFLGRHLHGADILPGQGTGWHEYGAYLGPLVIALGILGLTTLRRSRLVRALAISSALAILLSSAGPLLKPAFDQLPFLPRSTISRFILFAVIPVALLAGVGLDLILRRVARRKVGPAALLAILLPGLVAVDLMSLAYPLSEQAFVIPQNNVQITPAPPPIAFTANTYQTRLDGIDYTRSYLTTLAGYGTLNYCTPLSPEPSVVTVNSQYDSSYLTTTTASYGTAALVSFSPNRIRARATINQATDVVINTNYAKGWYVNDQPAHEIAGRVGIPLTPGAYNLAFRYRAPGLVFGSSLTLVTLMVAALFALRNFKVS